MIPAREYWRLLDRKPGVKKKRTSHIKVRTGCITCKARRVKCDEKKPLCDRCERAGIQCEGYLDRPEITKASQSKCQSSHSQAWEPGLLHPKPLQRIIIRAAEATLASPWLSASLSPVYLSGQDVSYLDAFRYHVVHDFNSWLTPGFWDSIVMRETMEDETIRHSILGLAAMTRVGMFTKEQSDEVVKNPDLALGYDQRVEFSSNHHEAALSHYAKAISSCRRNLASGTTEARGICLKRVLISTIIFIIIEMMHGNIKTATSLINNGLSLIQNAALHDNPSQADPELAVTEVIFKRFSIVGGLSPCFPGGREPAITIPDWQNPAIPPTSAPADTVLDIWNQLFRPLQPFMLKSAFGHHITEEDLETFAQNVDFQAKDLIQWQALIETYLKRTRDVKMRLSLVLIKVQVLITKINLTYRNNPTSLSYDAHIEDFMEIVNLADGFTESELAGRMRFTVDFNLFPWLGFTIAKCRNRSVRKHALETFIRLVFRQGGWGNLGPIKALQAVVSIDDRWPGGDGHAGDTTGYSWTLSHWDFEKRKIRVRFDPTVADPANYMIMREVVVDY